jgi:hypothetical protein
VVNGDEGEGLSSYESRIRDASLKRCASQCRNEELQLSAGRVLRLSRPQRPRRARPPPCRVEVQRRRREVWGQSSDHARRTPDGRRQRGRQWILGRREVNRGGFSIQGVSRWCVSPLGLVHYRMRIRR